MSKKTSSKSNEKKTEKQPKTAATTAKSGRAKTIKEVAKTKKGKAMSAPPVEVEAVESGAVVSAPPVEVEAIESGAVESAAPVEVEAVESGAVAASAPRAPNLRLPPIGTVIQKKDRNGAVRCECTVEVDGIHYGGKVYPSISGAATAAAIDIGLKTKTQNGYTFWGVEKVERVDPKEATERAWERYHEHIKALVTGATDKSKPEVKALVNFHTEELERLQDQVAQ